MSSVRTRFAPSPTGYLHIGGARTALFNFLFARHEGGKFILRVDDTDRERSTEEYLNEILESLSWLGLDWDEGPIFQSERMALYRDRADALLSSGLAYRCVCSPAEVDAQRKKALAEGRKPMYDGTCRDRALPHTDGTPYVVRFRAPREGATVVDDLVKGCVIFENRELDDLVLVRSDGSPTYNFCSVVDDAEIAVTHIIRGDDHLTNTPRQILIYDALGLPAPRFAHLPLILGTDRARLSKRHGAVSVTSYKHEGYLPEAMVNYLARLGWSLGDREVFSLSELIELFTLENVGKAAGIFNPEKLLWLNAHYIKSKPAAELARDTLPFLASAGLEAPREMASLERGIESLKPRAKTLVELVSMARYFLADGIELDPKATAKFLKPSVVGPLRALATRLEALPVWNEDSLHGPFDAVVEQHGLSMGKVAQPVRVAVTGGTASPGIFEVLEAVGKERTMARLRRAIEIAESQPA